MTSYAFKGMFDHIWAKSCVHSLKPRFVSDWWKKKPLWQENISCDSIFTLLWFMRTQTKGKNKFQGRQSAGIVCQAINHLLNKNLLENVCFYYTTRNWLWKKKMFRLRTTYILWINWSYPFSKVVYPFV